MYTKLFMFFVIRRVYCPYCSQEYYLDFLDQIDSTAGRALANSGLIPGTPCCSPNLSRSDPTAESGVILSIAAFDPETRKSEFFLLFNKNEFLEIKLVNFFL